MKTNVLIVTYQYSSVKTLLAEAEDVQNALINTNTFSALPVV